MINAHKYPFQKRLHEMRGLPPIYGVISGMQAPDLEAGRSVTAFPDVAEDVETTEQSLAITWYMPAPQHVLEAIHLIAAASADRLSKTA